MVTVINHLPLLDRIISTTNKDLVNRELPQEINIILGWGGGKKEKNSYIWNIFIHKNVPGIFTNEGIGNRCLLFKFSHNELLFKFLLVRIQNFCPQFHILSYWYFFLIFTHFHSLYSSYYFKYQSSSKYILYLLSETEYSSVLWSITIHLIYLPLAAAAAKSLQSCLTLCDPIDGKPPGSPVPGILQARILEWVAISFSNVWKWKVKVKLLSRAWLLVTPWTAAYQVPLSMGFSRQEYWSGVQLPSPICHLSVVQISSGHGNLVMPSSHWYCSAS